MAQLCHAAGESSPGVPHGTYAVVLGVPNEAGLLQIAKNLDDQKIAYILITETDAPYSGQATAIGLVPVTDRALVKPVLGKLKLYGTVRGYWTPCSD